MEIEASMMKNGGSYPLDQEPHGWRSQIDILEERELGLRIHLFTHLALERSRNKRSGHLGFIPGMICSKEIFFSLLQQKEIL